VKKLGLSLWIYTGFTWEELLALEGPGVRELLGLADVVVDGPFVRELADLGLAFRGSANQRLIDVRASLAAGEAVLWEPPRRELPPPVKREDQGGGGPFQMTANRQD
jgi:anaerobic ribonucleoside-triphosphate reductase activating protein